MLALIPVLLFGLASIQGEPLPIFSPYFYTLYYENRRAITFIGRECNAWQINYYNFSRISRAMGIQSLHATCCCNIFAGTVKRNSVVLFLLDREQQALLPLAYTGKLPDVPSSISSADTVPSVKQRAAQIVPLHGVFAVALASQGPLYVPALDQDRRVLPQELNWSYPAGSVLLNKIQAGDQNQGEQGVLVLCFSAENKNAHFPERMPPSVNEGDLLICSHLLSSTLIKETLEQQKDAAPLRVPRARRVARHKELKSEASELLHQQPPLEQLWNVPRIDVQSQHPCRSL